jgi:hypothetical protein
VSINLEAGFCWYSSTEPIDEREVDEAELVGESLGDPATVEGEDSAVTWRLMAGFEGRAVVLIVSVE